MANPFLALPSTALLRNADVVVFRNRTWRYRYVATLQRPHTIEVAGMSMNFDSEDLMNNVLNNPSWLREVAMDPLEWRHLATAQEKAAEAGNPGLTRVVFDEAGEQVAQIVTGAAGELDKPGIYYVPLIVGATAWNGTVRECRQVQNGIVLIVDVVDPAPGYPLAGAPIEVRKKA